MCECLLCGYSMRHSSFKTFPAFYKIVKMCVCVESGWVDFYSYSMRHTVFHKFSTFSKRRGKSILFKPSTVFVLNLSFKSKPLAEENTFVMFYFFTTNHWYFNLWGTFSKTLKYCVVFTLWDFSIYVCVLSIHGRYTVARVTSKFT